MTKQMGQASKIVRSACWAICTWLRSSRTSCRRQAMFTCQLDGCVADRSLADLD